MTPSMRRLTRLARATSPFIRTLLSLPLPAHAALPLPPPLR
jgi:hypothetical protein